MTVPWLLPTLFTHTHWCMCTRLCTVLIFFYLKIVSIAQKNVCCACMMFVSQKRIVNTDEKKYCTQPKKSLNLGQSVFVVVKIVRRYIFSDIPEYLRVRNSHAARTIRFSTLQIVQCHSTIFVWYSIYWILLSAHRALVSHEQNKIEFVKVYTHLHTHAHAWNVGYL